MALQLERQIRVDGGGRGGGRTLSMAIQSETTETGGFVSRDDYTATYSRICNNFHDC